MFAKVRDECYRIMNFTQIKCRKKLERFIAWRRTPVYLS